MIKTGINEGGDRDGQEWTHVICDATSIIVDDNVTLHPGYIEISDSKVIAHYSDDPNNKENPFLVNEKGEATGKNPNFSIGMLTNRVEYRRTEVLGDAPDEYNGTHFISLEAMNQFIDDVTRKVAEEEAKAAEPIEAAQAVADAKAEAGQAEDVPDESVEEPEQAEEVAFSDEIVEDTVMDETPVVEETVETPTEEVVTETPSEDVVAEETPAVETPEEVTPVDDIGEVSPTVEDTSTEEPESEVPVEETETETDVATEVAGAHLVDMGGISRCSVCMLTSGAIGDDIATHMAIHNGTAEPAVEAEPTGGMMTTENTPA
jgi:hypothetical protein